MIFTGQAVQEFETLLMDVWREASRHLEIAESADRIAAILAKHIPVAKVIVRKVDVEKGSLESISVGTLDTVVSRADGRIELKPDELERVLQWCRAGVPARSREAVAAVCGEDPLAAIDPQADLLAGPLTLSEGRYGVLLLIGRSGATFTAEQRQWIDLLLEPFSVALENDCRVGMIASLREAAEADRQSLLARLGRKNLADTIIGSDSGLRAVMERVQLVAKSDVPVLIFGETGAGKELIARAIHTRSNRAAGPFLRVNCGAIPSELIDSQLFGHERGAFTGAVETRKGWFERAHGGTLLLDELGELPLAAQVRLLRILQDGWLERVGGHQPIHVDVRIVAATHRDLAAMAAEGRFREDLWYRIAVFPIVLPPLRERRSDIAQLACHFAGRAAVRFGLTTAMPTAEDLRLLTAYNWPGNVRELAAVIDRAAILGEGRRLEVAKALGVGIALPTLSAESTAIQQPAMADGAFASLDHVVVRHIETALTATGGRIEGPHGAAKLLGINPHTLRAKMRKLRIDWKRFRGSRP